jgi:hypothetical protein
MQRTSSCAAKSRCSRPTTRVIIEDVNVLQLIVSDRRLLKNDKISDAYLPSGFASASVGTLRIDRSWRFFDTACSLNDDFPFDRRLFEKLSLLNILGRWVGRLSKWRLVAQQNHSKMSMRVVVEIVVICVDLVDKRGRK